jgi:hypothetical protein
MGPDSTRRPIVLTPDVRRAGSYPILWTAIGAVVALVGGVAMPSSGGFNSRFALVIVAIFWGWAAAWYAYYLLFPCRVRYVWDGAALQAFHRAELVREVHLREIADVAWGLETLDWSAMWTAAWGMPSAPRLLVTIRGATRWASAPLSFPPICVWGEDALQIFLDELHQQLRLEHR